MTSVAKKYKVSPSALGKFLKYLNIPVENKQNRVKFDDTVFDEIDSEEKAYWLGFLYADGYISNTPLRADVKSRYDFELTLAEKDYSHLVKFNTFTKHEKLNIKSKSVKLDGKTFKSFRWGIVNKHFWNALNQLGCTPQKSLTLKFPTFLPLELIRHFIRGYFDGDGSLGIYTTKYDTKRIQVSCLGTESMLQGILNASNQTASLQKDKRMTSSKTFEFELCSEKAVNFLNYIYKDCTIYLTRKYEKYLESCRLWEESHRLLESNIGEKL